MYAHTHRERRRECPSIANTECTSITHTHRECTSITECRASRTAHTECTSTFHKARHTHSGAPQVASWALHRRPTCTWWGDPYAQCTRHRQRKNDDQKRRHDLEVASHPPIATSHALAELSPSLSSLSSLTLPSLVSHLSSLRALASSLAISLALDASKYPRTALGVCTLSQGK